MAEVWGQIYLDQMTGDGKPYVIERDDGVVHPDNSPSRYFDLPGIEA